MILQSDQLSKITNKGIYECVLIKKRFSNEIFKETMSPIGNIISFVSPTQIGNFSIKKSLVFCAELLNSGNFAGVCFQRLFSLQVGSIASELTNTQYYMNENSLMTEGKQATIVITNHVKTSFLFHVFFSLEPESTELAYLNVSDIEKFQIKANESFYYLANSIFLESQRDNF